MAVRYVSDVFLLMVADLQERNRCVNLSQEEKTQAINRLIRISLSQLEHVGAVCALIQKFSTA